MQNHRNRPRDRARRIPSATVRDQLIEDIALYWYTYAGMERCLMQQPHRETVGLEMFRRKSQSAPRPWKVPSGHLQRLEELDDLFQPHHTLTRAESGPRNSYLL